MEYGKCFSSALFLSPICGHGDANTAPPPDPTQKAPCSVACPVACIISGDRDHKP